MDHNMPANPHFRSSLMAPLLDGYSTHQGASSETWHCPPLDGSLILPQTIDWHYTYSPNHPFFVYSKPGDEEEPSVIKWKDAALAIHRTARSFIDLVGCGPRRIIAVLAIADSITYALVILAIMRAGHIPFPISPRNSAPILAHLMSKTSSKVLLLSRATGMQALVKEANLPEDVTIVDFPTFDHLFTSPSSSEKQPESLILPPLTGIGMSDAALILHSSGSTAFPKPIPISHEWVFQQGLLPWFGELDLCGHISALHSIPMFHFSGAVQPWWAALTGLVLAVLPPSPTPTVPSPEAAFQGVVRTRSTIIYGISVHIEQWACDPKKVAHLATLQAVIFQGAPLTRHAGNTLTKAGVPLVPVYGATEVGGLTIIFPDRRRRRDLEHGQAICAPPVSSKVSNVMTDNEEEEEGAFEWFRLSPRVCAEFVPYSRNEIVDGRTCDIFELVVVQTPSHRLNVTNKTLPDGRAAYATNDLLVRHPARRGQGGWWRVFGRKDDQITLGTGEKVNPVPLEGMLVKDDPIASAILFGRGRFNMGVLVSPSEQEGSSLIANFDLVEFRDRIWPTVEKMNGFAPAYAKVFKEMILVAKPTKPFEYTPKGSPRRQVVLAAYEQEIEEAYSYDATNTSPAPFSLWSNEVAVCVFLRNVFATVLKGREVVLGEKEDLFAAGCDSLGATHIRNILSHALQASNVPLASQKLDVEAVYKYPTIQSLARYLVGLVSSCKPLRPLLPFLPTPPATPPTDAEDTEILSMSSLSAPSSPFSSPVSSSSSSSFASSLPDTGDKINEMEMLIDELTHDLPSGHRRDRVFPTHHHGAASNHHRVRDVVLITGTTGGLGAHMLVELLKRSNVERVYALNRPGVIGSSVSSLSEASSSSSSISLLMRQEKALREKKLDPAWAHHEKLVLLQGNTAFPRFGMDQDIYSQMKNTVTQVIHNAWPVDFNYALSSFRPALNGLRNLIEFCLDRDDNHVANVGRSPRLVFISSISVARHYCGPLPVPEKPLPDLLSAVGLGYGESKLVAERILEVARERSGLEASIVRVGQLCGSSGVCGGGNGVWNTREWFPALVQASDVLGCVPDLDFDPNKIDIDWVPIDVAGQAIIDMYASSSSPSSLSPGEYMHIVHPRPTTCRGLLKALSRELCGAPVVPYAQWYLALEALSRQQEDGTSERRVATDSVNSSDGVGKKPVQAIHLLRFFRGSPCLQQQHAGTGTAYESSHMAAPTFMLGQPLDMRKTLEASPPLNSLGKLKNLEETDVSAWVSYWREVGFLR